MTKDLKWAEWRWVNGWRINSSTGLKNIYFGINSLQIDTRSLAERGTDISNSDTPGTPRKIKIIQIILISKEEELVSGFFIYMIGQMHLVFKIITEQ